MYGKYDLSELRNGFRYSKVFNKLKFIIFCFLIFGPYFYCKRIEAIMHVFLTNWFNCYIIVSVKSG